MPSFVPGGSAPQPRFDQPRAPEREVGGLGNAAAETGVATPGLLAVPLLAWCRS